MWRCRALNSNRVLIETSLKKMTFTERRAQLSELLGTPLSPGYRSVAFVSGTRRRTIPPLATQHDTSLEGGGGDEHVVLDRRRTAHWRKRRANGAATDAQPAKPPEEVAVEVEKERRVRREKGVSCTTTTTATTTTITATTTVDAAATAERDVRFHI